ncbi:hypothetical protein [Absidia glauca]|uniref:Extracellular membrane protein CFEM domain-containing protein n=1 Tax=Absidia glauca TaxID=4829 RepID=A0A168M957_ABSGL|nr:hypothetical protein [Absidia glauca]
MKTTLTSVCFLALTASYLQSVNGQSACADQAVFDLCRQNQDKYLSTCAVTGTQENIVAADCSVPGANVTTSWSSTPSSAPTSTSIAITPTNGAAAAKPSSDTAPSVKQAGSAMALVTLMMATYFLT